MNKLISSFKLVTGFAIILSIMSSCSTPKKVMSPLAKTWQDEIDIILDTNKVVKTGFTGIKVINHSDQKLIYEKNSDKYFTPASNTKIITLYSSLKMLGDSIPALKYVENDTALIFWGTADPSLLHPFMPKSDVLDFLEQKGNVKKLIYADGHNDLKHYGDGWMWNDFAGYYQPELAPLPIYGNIVYFKKDSTGTAYKPESLLSRSRLNPNIKRIDREREANIFEIPSILDQLPSFEQEIPYKDAAAINIQLLSSLVSKPIESKRISISKNANTLFSIPKDTLLRRMMQISDNMLADHMLINAGFVSSDSLSDSHTIATFKKTLFHDLPQPLKWTDGSGLSRYNAFTPSSLVAILQKMLNEYPKDRVYSLMAQGGKYGTLGNMFKNEETPYIFAKTGSLSGVYCLSGYMTTKQGKTFIFSIMNNNFVGSTTNVRQAVSQILEKIRENY